MLAYWILTEQGGLSCIDDVRRGDETRCQKAFIPRLSKIGILRDKHRELPSASFPLPSRKERLEDAQAHDL